MLGCLIAAGILILTMGGFISFSQPVYADERYWTDPATGFAMGGYDVVSYWSSGGPVLGTDDYEVQKGNVTWRFSNQGNYEEFLKHYEVYAPQFSGYGAYGVAQGKTPRGNPKIWMIADNKLYFFFSLEARTRWGLARKKYIREAIKNWPVLKRQISHLN